MGFFRFWSAEIQNGKCIKCMGIDSQSGTGVIDMLHLRPHLKAVIFLWYADNICTQFFQPSASICIQFGIQGPLASWRAQLLEL